jgi:hypothetical protein
MTANEYVRCMDRLNLSHHDISRLLDCSVQLSKKWADGSRSVPPMIEQWLLGCIDVRLTYPYPDPPEGWRRSRSGPQRQEAW